MSWTARLPNRAINWSTYASRSTRSRDEESASPRLSCQAAEMRRTAVPGTCRALTCAGKQAQVTHRLVRCVQESELHEFVWPDVLDALHSN